MTTRPYNGEPEMTYTAWNNGFGSWTGDKWHPALTSVPEALATGNFDLRTNCRVTKVLTDAEYKNLSLYLENLTVAAPGSACGADKSILEVTITTPSGKQVYGDSFYSCTIKDKPLLKTETISSLFQQLYNLTM